MKTIVFFASLIISLFYGFFILFLFDMVMPKRLNEPLFRLPTMTGILRGIGVSALYFLLNLLLKRIAKIRGNPETNRFVAVNAAIFSIGLAVFVFIECFVSVSLPLDVHN